MEYNGYAVPSNTPWITTKPLKRTPRNEITKAMDDYIEKNNLIVRLDDGSLQINIKIDDLIQK